jgi:imidazolonepropionase
MPILTNIGVLAACRFEGGQSAIHALERAALVWNDGLIEWVGREAELPFADYRRHQRIDAGGRLVIPGLIDCHTHLAFGGWRANEFEERIQGRSYAEIAAAGGGIAVTVAATRASTSDQLVARCAAWLAAMSALGVTTVEAKSGYGLNREHELRLLEVYRELNLRQPVRVVPTFLGAHIVPPDYRDRRQDYLELLCTVLIPEVARRSLARYCDVFVEQGAYSVAEARSIFRAARQHGLIPKLHADQLTDLGGAVLAADVDAASADHLDCVSAEGIARLAESRTVAVSLPVATLYLNRPPTPARRLIEAGVPVAVATDFNPGTAPTFHLPFALLLACTMQRMTPAEALKGATIFAARAIGEDAVAGSLEPGKRADFALIDAPNVTHWLYHFSENRCLATYIAGQRVFGEFG